MILTETPKRQMVTRLVTWGHWFTLSNIIVAIVIAGIYLFSSALPDTPLGMLYLVANWFSHIGFLTFFGFVLVILPLCYVVPRSRFIRAWASVVAAFGLAFLAFDALLYTRHGLHFSPHSAEFIKQQTNVVLAGLEVHQIMFLLVSFLVWLMFQLLIANSLWHRIEKLQKLRIAVPISSTFVALFVFSHISHIWADANLYEPIVKQDNMFPLSYPATAKTLMSKYGMLNMEDYRNKKQLKFGSRFNDIDYPKRNAICAVDSNNKILLGFISSDGSTSNLGELQWQGHNMTQLPAHFNLAADAPGGVVSAMYGLPEIYHTHLTHKKPLIVEMLESAQLPLSSFASEAAISTLFQQMKLNPESEWSQFETHFNQATQGLFVFNSSIEHLQRLNLTPDVKILLTAFSDNQQVLALTNLTNAKNKVYSSHEDIAPSLIETLGCNLPSDIHSTGQSISAPQRNWIIGSQDGKIMIIHENLITEIDPSGNYILRNLDGTPQNNVELNIPLLGQAIKLLSSFNQ